MKTKIFILAFFMLLIISPTAYSDEEIIYTRLTDSYWQLWKYNPNTKENIQLTKDKSDKTSPFYDVNGDIILYRSNGGKLFSFNPKTKKAKQLYPAIQYISDAKIIDNTLLFTRQRTTAIDDSDIWMINTKTDKETILTNQPKLQFQPALLKDKKTLLYVSGLEPDNHQIFKKDLKTSKIIQLTSGMGYQLLPRPSPDNQSILYVSNITGNYQIWKMDINGKNKKQLTDNENIDTFPCWSPDGKEIVYASYIGGKYCLMTMDSNGKNQRLLFESNNDCTEPHWVRTD